MRKLARYCIAASSWRARAASTLAWRAPPSNSGSDSVSGPSDQVASWLLTPPAVTRAAPMLPFRLRRGRRAACAWPMSWLAATHSRSALPRSGRWRSSAAGTSGTAMAAGWAIVPLPLASAVRKAGSSVPVNATMPLTSKSHCARCCVNWLLPCAALARLSAALAGAEKPALALSSVRRAVSAREAASS